MSGVFSEVLRDFSAQTPRHQVSPGRLQPLVCGHQPTEHKTDAGQHFVLHLRYHHLEVRYVVFAHFVVQLVEVTGTDGGLLEE